jgi:serine protease Do
MSNAATGAGTSGGIGLSLRPLTAVERATLRKEAGLLVTGTSGTAALAGIRPGDVVLAVNGTSVGTTQALQAALANSGSVAALLIEREKQQTFVPVPLNTQHDVTTETD